MRPRDHVIWGGVAAAALYPVLGAKSLVFWGASAAIDIDHYMDYVYHNGFRDWSWRRMFEYHRILSQHWFSPQFLNMEVFHTVEFLAALFIVATLDPTGVVMAVFAGFVFHCLLDVVFLTREGILTKRAHSLTEYFLRKRAMEARGLSPTRLCDYAAAEATAGRD